jgi:transcriptional regulator with XRE-family HTH domain
MGYRGKLQEQTKARRLRTRGWTLDEIAHRLQVSKSSVSLWVRDVEFQPRLWRRQYRSGHRSEHPLHLAKLREIDELDEAGRRRIGVLSDREFLVTGLALYAGEGAKTDGAVKFANSDPALLGFFCTWLRYFFDVDESRLRLRLYLHQGLDIEAANRFWAGVTAIPLEQFGKPYRAKADPSIRRAKHPMGCPSIGYACSRTHRAIMGLVRALVTCDVPFRGGEIGITADC